MPKLELTDKTIKAAKVSEGTRKLDLFDTLARGLCLRVGAGGTKAFYFVYSDASGKRVWNKLGEYGEHTGQFTLAAARKQAKELRGYVAGGNDPAAEKRSERAALTVFDMVENYLTRAVASRRSVDEIARRLRKNVSGKDSEGNPLVDDKGKSTASEGVIGNVKLSDLHRRDLTKCIDALKDRGAHVEANRLFEDIRAMVRWARGRGDLDENLTENMRKPTETAPRERWLTEDEIKIVWKALPDADMRESTRRIIRLCLITGQRVGEVSGMTREELSDDATLWTIPGERAKNKQQHKVPLSSLAMQIILEQQADVEALAARKGRDVPDEIFPSPGFHGPAGADSIPKALKRLDVNGNVLGVPAWTPHDLRRTCATHMEMLGVSPHVIGHCLNHISTTKATVTTAVYARYDYAKEKAEALSLWSDRLTAITSGSGAKVLPMRKNAK